MTAAAPLKPTAAYPPPSPTPAAGRPRPSLLGVPLDQDLVDKLEELERRVGAAAYLGWGGEGDGEGPGLGFFVDVDRGRREPERYRGSSLRQAVDRALSACGGPP